VKVLLSHQAERELLLPAPHCPRACCNTERKDESKGTARAWPRIHHVPDTHSELNQRLARLPHHKLSPAPSGASRSWTGSGEQQLLDPCARAQKGGFQAHCQHNKQSASTPRFCKVVGCPQGS